MIEGTCPNEDCSNNEDIFELDEENKYCPKCGTKLVETNIIDDDSDEQPN